MVRGDSPSYQLAPLITRYKYWELLHLVAYKAGKPSLRSLCEQNSGTKLDLSPVLILAWSKDEAKLSSLRTMWFTVVCCLDCTPCFKLLSSISMEACPGFNLLLECNTEGPVSTVYNGTLMNCNTSNNEIALLHNRFNQENRTCNNGKVWGLPVNDSGNCYTSLLCIMFTQDMVGKTVRCVHDNGTRTVEIGNYLIPPILFNTTATCTTITPTAGNLQLHTNICQKFKWTIFTQHKGMETLLVTRRMVHTLKVHSLSCPNSL